MKNIVQLIIDNGRHCQIAKGELVFRQDYDNDENIYFVVKGLLKSFYEDYDGKKFIKSFISENNMISSVHAKYSTSKNTYSLEAIEDTNVIVISRETLVNIIVEPELQMELVEMLLTIISEMGKRSYELLCLSPTDRYLAFIEDYPNMENRILQVDVAQYLGITPVALSRIRRRYDLIK